MDIEQFEIEKAKAEAARAEWFAKWPNACTHCEGHGGDYSQYDPSPAGISLGSGYMTDFDPCQHCIGAEHGERIERDEEDEWAVILGKCPRCAVLMDAESEKPCPSCGWNWGYGLEDAVPRLPEYEPDEPDWYTEDFVTA